MMDWIKQSMSLLGCSEVGRAYTTVRTVAVYRFCLLSSLLFLVSEVYLVSLHEAIYLCAACCSSYPNSIMFSLATAQQQQCQQQQRRRKLPSCFVSSNVLAFLAHIAG